jgi:hypothetical protein
MKAVEELTPSVGTSVACEAIGVPRATVYRHRLPKAAAAPKPRPAPPRALSGDERNRVLDVLHGEAFADKAPAETYAKLLDQGSYLCSIRTMELVLKANQKVRERRNQFRHPAYAKPQLVATPPNQAWTWDITKLLGLVSTREAIRAFKAGCGGHSHVSAILTNAWPTPICYCRQAGAHSFQRDQNIRGGLRLARD